MACRVVFVGPDKSPSLLYGECSVPSIYSGQILAKIKLATICDSDLTAVSANAVPSVLGHEAVAEVLENQRSDCPLVPGDRIIFSAFDICGACGRCRLGIPQKCSKLLKYGHRNLSQASGFTGCFASHIVLEKGTTICKVPLHISDPVACVINCPVATMVNAVSSIPQNCRKALVQGAGLLGLFGCVLLKERGFLNVYVTDVNEARLQHVSKFGGLAFNLNGSSQTSRVSSDAPCGKIHRNAPKEETMDVVIEVSGGPGVLSQGLRYLRPGGMYVFVDTRHSQLDLQFPVDVLMRKMFTMQGVLGYQPCHLEEAVDFVSRTTSQYPYDSLFGPEFSLSSFHEAVGIAKEKKFHRVIVRPPQ
ncbi:hypothetical protein NP493_352g06042 [Ridgeia piscesae]|uniref:alcohol dehydrogenase n=1 Tax=Ridgeia piscesae TaxID=27915 RepID=A0AAD9NTS9_RIDPI|nr:hypothetical protein NP493_352g06042 [Ridgeia piscesae]